VDKKFSNIEIVTLSVYLLGGDSSFIDTEDIAVKANQLAPGRFTWRKYPDQINISSIAKRLSDAKDPNKGGYLLGSFKQGWMLSEEGLVFSKERKKELEKSDLHRIPMNRKELIWKNREKERMLSSDAYEKLISDGLDSITVRDAEAFFRVDDYVTGSARERKIVRIKNMFKDDPDLGKFIRILESKVRGNG